MASDSCSLTAGCDGQTARDGGAVQSAQILLHQALICPPPPRSPPSTTPLGPLRGGDGVESPEEEKPQGHKATTGGNFVTELQDRGIKEILIWVSQKTIKCFNFSEFTLILLWHYSTIFFYYRMIVLCCWIINVKWSFNTTISHFNAESICQTALHSDAAFKWQIAPLNQHEREVFMRPENSLLVSLLELLLSCS